MPAPSPRRGAKRTKTRRAPPDRESLATAPDPIAAQLREIEHLNHAELKERWAAVYGGPAPVHAKRPFLLRAVAYRIQVEALGGLDAGTRRRLAKIADDLAAGRKPKTPPLGSTTTGTRLIREWRGEVHEVVVVEGGVQYRGELWASLSAVAREITGTRWSGPRFFGLRSPRNGHR